MEINNFVNKKDLNEFNVITVPMEPKGSMGNSLSSSLVDRYFTPHGRSPFEFDMYGNPINWVYEDVNVTDDRGKVVFTQKNVRKPDFWSTLALKVVASKYFWGDQAKNEREDSVEKIISRVSRFIGRQSVIQKYFSQKEADSLRDEVASICLHQLAVFNSPVWFNTGIHEYDKNAGGVSTYVWDAETDKINKSEKTMDRPQCSACFIQSIEDNMDSIMAVQVAEANLFKAGSGTGTNRSTLRSSREKLTGGGRSSGPLSFMKGYDAYAGAIKSGGKTRRAAKMEILNVDHPDVIEFIETKQKEEKKAWALIEQGYGGGMNGEAYASVAFQNCNMSVRATDEFMRAVKNDGEWQTHFVTNGAVSETLKAKEILRKIAEGTHICGDPGMQFDTIINKYHTSKVSGKINASNPCSEYMFLDDSACNLASINLMKFLTSEGKFETESFKKVVDRFITSMELFVDGSSYPTEKITRNSHDFRPLGLGYANLGALLMSLGLPYDSNEGRAVAAAITALMCGQAYKASAKIASVVGPFPRYQENRDSMLEVIKMHRDHVKDIDVNKIPYDLRYLINEAWDSWSEAYELGKQYGFRNSQTTVLAPTGTIAFMMDCDTTGIEPDIALVKYKVLSGGGMLKIVNRSVPLALQRLGYNTADTSDMIAYINEKDTIEGAPHLKLEHLPIFDCAFKAANGKRAIHFKGHVLMMAVCQPYISGAISKTVNMPESSTVEEIMDAYILSWESGLKAVAIYRENSKRSQPLNTKKTEGEVVAREIVKEVIREVIVKQQERQPLPQTRRSLTHKFEIGDHKGYLTVGLYDNGKPGEVFVTIAKQGSTIRGLIDAWALSMSMNLQYGVPVSELFGLFRHQKFEPAGFVRNDEALGKLDEAQTPIRTASSIVDYIAQFMLNNFGAGSGGMEVDIPQLELSSLKEEQKALEDFAHTTTMQDSNNINNNNLQTGASGMGAGTSLSGQNNNSSWISTGNNINNQSWGFGNGSRSSSVQFKDAGLSEGLVCGLCGGPAKRIGNCAIICTSCNTTQRSGCGE
ncbi:vitamin B12-dependent ribonucleotide reductase [Candidatus Pacearchaeota archaeon]|nr:vitamin B12-dependent ribonucleotide reductase [Candidatus Pacearchaeota archaeon]